MDRIAENYFVEVGREKQPSAEEEKAIFTRIMVARSEVQRLTKKASRGGGGNCRSELARWEAELKTLEASAVTGYVKFVVKKARKYTKNPDLLREVIGYGNLGLMDAMLRYDVTRKLRFLTYAAWWIRARIQEFLNRNGTVHMPVQARNVARKRRQAEDVEMLLGQRTSYSAEEPSVWHVEVETLSSVSAPPSDEKLMFRRMDEAMLSVREKTVLIYSYGLCGTNEKSSEEIMDALFTLDGVYCPLEHVRHLRDHALEKLRKQAAW